MSLLNEALRKKSEEKTSSRRPPLSNPHRTRRVLSKPVMVIALVALGLLAGTLAWWSRTVPHQPKTKPTPANTVAKATSITQEQGHAAPPRDDGQAVVSAPFQEHTAPALPEKPQPEQAVVADPKHDIPRAPDGPSPNEQTSTRTDTTTPTPKIPQVAAAPRPGEAMPAPEAPPSPTHPEAPFMEKALSYHRGGLTEKAMDMYREVLLRNPGHDDALINLTSLLIDRQRFAESVSLLRQRAQKSSADPRLYLHLAIAEIGLQQPHKALADLAEAEGLGGETYELLFHRGVAHGRIGDLEQAVASYKKAEDLRPDHAALLFNLALALDKGQRYAEALAYYQKFLGQAPHDSRQRSEIEKRVDTLQTYLASQQPSSQSR